MIPYTLIIIGIGLILWSIYGFVRLLFLPFSRMTSVVFKRKDDFLKYESKEGRKYFTYNLRQLTWAFVISLVLGVFFFFLGIYLGYAAKGPSFWFYEKVFGSVEVPAYQDKLSDEGKYISKEGSQYTYYVIVDGNSYIFNGENCADEHELESKLDLIEQNKLIFSGVILVDNYGVSSKFHEAERIIKEKGVEPRIEDSSER